MDKIICLGKNYFEHAKELGDAVPEKPVLFLKPPSVLLHAEINGEMVKARLPVGAGSIHHECEIVIQLSRGGYRLNEAAAKQCIGAYSLGLDMTLRERQAAQKKNGHPWTTSKVFIDAAVVGPWIKASEINLEAPFSFTLDGVVKQTGRVSDMTLSPLEAVIYASECFPLVAGDLIFTGTPAGVGPVIAGKTGKLEWCNLQYSVTWADEATS